MMTLTCQTEELQVEGERGVGVREQAEPDHVSLPLHWPPQSDRLRSSKTSVWTETSQSDIEHLGAVEDRVLGEQTHHLEEGPGLCQGTLGRRNPQF